MPSARETIEGRIDYYLESARDNLENPQGFAIELLATTMLDLEAVQAKIDEQAGTAYEEDGIADAVTAMVFAKMAELYQTLQLDRS